MARSAILSIKILADALSAKRELDDTATALDRFESGVNRATPAAAGVAAAVGAMGTAAYQSASELQQSTGAVSSVFGRYAGEVTKYATSAASDVGLAQSQYQNMAAVIGSQLKTMGTPMQAVAGDTNNLISLGADLAATYGGTTASAVEALSSLLRGERDPIEKYGVSIKQADINAQLAAMGLTGLTGEAAKTAEAQATLALLTQQTADVQGQFARETDTAAGAQQIATAQYENAKAALGEQLLPAVTAVMTALGDLAVWVQNNTGATTALVAVVAGLAGSVLAANAAIKVYRATQIAITAATKAWTVAQRALNLVMRANPIGLIITAVAALAAGFIYAYNKSATFRKFVDKLWGAIKNFAASAVTRIRQVWNWITNLGSAAASVGRSIASFAANVVARFKHIGEWIRWAAKIVTGTLGNAWSWVKGRWDYFYNSVKNGFNYIVDLIKWAKSWLGNLFSFQMPGWMRTVSGWVGGIFSVQAVPADDTMTTARAFDATNSAADELVRPAVFAPASRGLAAPGSGSGAPLSITVNGAMDAEAVARQIEQMLTRLNRRRGRIALGAV